MAYEEAFTSQGGSDRHVGLDAHASSCTLAVVGPSGKRLGSYVVEANGLALMKVLRGVPGSRHLCMEEGTLAERLHDALEPHVKERTSEPKSYRLKRAVTVTTG